ncbi:MAG: T9SS type A sorting domain-containing protein [Bacteroidia bacterium]|nr:T9SS type A sorting domain-containing protein [Bacteroidia bacterium]
MKHITKFLIALLIAFFSFIQISKSQPNWPAIKSGATFFVADTTYGSPYIQPINVPGWEDGLFMTRDGKNLYSTYLPVDAFSWITDLVLNPICFNFHPYYRPPLLGIDTVTNVFGCPNYMHSDIIYASRTDTTVSFNAWNNSNLQTSFSFDGGAHGVLLNADSFDVFVFTKDGPGTQSTDIMFMKNVPVNPTIASAVPILSTTGQEDNPHIERLNDTTLVLLFDRDRYMHYSLSYDNGTNWQTPVLITNVLNDQAPYDVQPHLYNDGTDWWVYFCTNSVSGIRGIYKSKQLIANDWDSWGPKELVIEPNPPIGTFGTVFGIGEPTLTQWGDLSFVVVYGDINSADTTDVFDCDPWYLPKKGSTITKANNFTTAKTQLLVFPNPANGKITVRLSNANKTKTEIQIFDALGNKVKQFEMYIQQQIDISDLPAGFYFIGIKDDLFTRVKLIKF